MSKKIEIGENLGGIILIIVVLIFIFFMSSCNPNQKPMLGSNARPFIVNKIVESYEFKGMAEYYSYGSSKLKGIDPCVILPIGIANIDDTIKIEIIYKK